MRIAVGQVEPVYGNVDLNVTTTVRVIRDAAARGAELIVLPELVSSGYMFHSREEAFALSEAVGDGPATRAWSSLARELDIIVVAGFPERAGDVLYNAALIALPSGETEVYRKVHLWDEEALYFEPGDLGFPSIATRHGRIGAMICYDGWFPESYRALADQGVDLVCVPTNWVPIPGQDPHSQAMATILTMAAAHSNGMAVAAADRVGVERGQEFIGQSIIASHTGWPAAGPAAKDSEELLIADIDVAGLRRARGWGQFNNVLKDRRPDAYEVHR